MRVLASKATRCALALAVSLIAIDTASAHACAPSPRSLYSAVWTGTELIVWGGIAANQPLASGARYNPATDRWTPMSTAGAPAGRGGHTAVWTGREMVVWGGADQDGVYATGGRYDPATDTWTATALTGAAPARELHSAVWTGSSMLVYGGVGGRGSSNDGLASAALYDPAADACLPVPDAPDPRRYHGATWTPAGMLVWGGYRADKQLDSIALYDPATKQWTALPTPAAPVGDGAWAWTGTQLLAWGGTQPGDMFDTGFSFDPATRAWSRLPTANAPSARRLHSVVWTGTEAIAWGGYHEPDNADVGTGARLHPGTGTWAPIASQDAPVARRMHVAEWTGTRMLVWGGIDARQNLVDGALYDLAGDRWTPMSNLCAGHDH